MIFSQFLLQTSGRLCGRQVIDGINRGAKQHVVALEAGLVTESRGQMCFAQSDAAEENHIAFFVDEDPNRIGRDFMGKPVISPNSVPPGSRIIVPLAYSVAKNIANRLKGASYDVILPPEPVIPE